MADRQQQYRGKKANLPTLLEGELGFCTDTKEVYIGTANGNVLVTVNKAEEVPALATNAVLADVITAVNSLISNLKTAGIMK
jgi:hypothetical protein